MTLLETIKWEGGRFHNLAGHQQRLEKSHLAVFGAPTCINLAQALRPPSRNLAASTRYKVRVCYQQQGIARITWLPYTPRAVRSLKLLPLPEHYDYAHKYADRRVLDELYAQRGHADDVLLLRDGWLTDTSYANVALYDGQRWLTPKSPLLEGTQRALLIAQNTITPQDIHQSDIPHFQSVKIINAMLDFHSTAPISVKNLHI